MNEEHTAAELEYAWKLIDDLASELSQVENLLRKTRIANTRLVNKMEVAYIVLGWDFDEGDCFGRWRDIE